MDCITDRIAYACFALDRIPPPREIRYLASYVSLLVIPKYRYIVAV